jgi:hypothetical protein
MKLREPGFLPDYSPNRETSIKILLAGGIAEIEGDPLCSTKSASSDCERIHALRAEDPRLSDSDIIGLEAETRAVVLEHFSVIKELAEALLLKEYENRRNRGDQVEWSESRVARYLSGGEIRAVLPAVKLCGPPLAWISTDNR